MEPLKTVMDCRSNNKIDINWCASELLTTKAALSSSFCSSVALHQSITILGGMVFAILSKHNS